MNWQLFGTVFGAIFTALITGGGVVYLTIKSWHDDLKVLKKQVEQDQANRIARVEHNVEALREAANPPLIAAQITAIREGQERRLIAIEETLKAMVSPALIKTYQDATTKQLSQIEGQLDELNEVAIKTLAEHGIEIGHLKEDVTRAHTKISDLRKEIAA